MNTQPDSHEWETLSAYLDGALSPAEKQRLEARLQTSPELQQILQELRITRILLRSVPRRRAPRNFTLTPQMAGIRPPQRNAWLVPVFSMSSALATLLLVISMLMEMFAAPGAAAPLQLVAAPSAAQPQAELDTTLALEPTEPPMIITWSYPGMGGGGSMDMPYGAVAEGKGGGEAEPMMIMEAPVEEAEAKQAPPEESVEPAAEPAAEEAGSSMPTEEVALAEAAAPMLSDEATEAMPMTEESVPAVEPTPTAQEDYPETALAAPPAEDLALEEAQPLPTEISPLPTSESARAMAPTQTPVAYADEALQLEAQPPLELESPEELRNGSDQGEVIIFGLPSPENAGQIMPTSSAMAKAVVELPSQADQITPVQPFDWKILRLVLLFIAAICGGLAIILHRRKNS
jgi:hypothetical protein